MKKIYHLGNCSTCQRILSEVKPGKEVLLQDIKTEAMTAKQVDEMAKLAGSYEALFSRVALKYRALGLNTKKLSETDYRNYIIKEYTFLKRPVAVIGKKIFIGNTKANVEALKNALK